jgi:hypothetical protein
MYPVRNSVYRIKWTAALLVALLGTLACNAVTRLIQPETAPPPQAAITVEAPTAQVVMTVEAQPTNSPNDGQEQAPESGEANFTYDGDFNGVKYQLDLPANFIHSTSGGWQQFCLDASDKLCVSIQPQSGSWNDAEAMADEVITGFSRSVGNYQELDRQSTYSGEGFPAYQVGYTYTWHDKNLEGSRLFIVVQNIGFDISAEGQAALMDKYRAEIKSIMDSFRLNYN